MEIFGDLASGNCVKIKLTADRLELPYDWVHIDITKGESRTSSFLAMSPMGQVPIVRLADGRVLAQSNAIIRYLAHGTPLLPDDPFEQAKIDEVLFWEQYSHEPYIGTCRYQVVYLGKPFAERDAWRVERGEKALDLMDAMLEGRDWIAGKTISIADIALLPYTRFSPEGGFELSSRRNVSAWIARCEGELALPPLAA